LREKLSIEQVRIREGEIKSNRPSLRADLARAEAIKEVAGLRNVAPSTLLEWMDHPTRLHRRNRRRK
jgi:hypothetical protein